MNDYFGDFKVDILEVPGRMTYQIFLSKPVSAGLVFIKNDATATVVKEGELINQNELFFANLSGDQLHAFAEALSNKGIKTNKDSVAEGKLVATERHLEDMRMIALAKYRPKAGDDA